MLNGSGGNTPVLLNRWMSASMTEVKRLLQIKPGKAQREAVLLTAFRSSFFLQLLFRNPAVTLFGDK